MPVLNQYQQSVALIIIGGVFLSTLGLGVRMMEQADSYQITFYRAISQAVFMTLVLWGRNREGLLDSFALAGKPGFIAGLMFSGASIFLILSLTHTTVANAMFVTSLAPFLAAILAWIFLREKVSGSTMLAILIAIIGVAIMINGALSSEGMLGIFYGFGMAFFYAGFTVALRTIKQGDTMVATCWGSYLVLILIGLFVSDLSINTHDLILCLLLGIFQLGLGGICIVLGARHVPAAQIALLAMLEVVLSPIWVWLGVGETPSSMTLIGGGFIFFAIAYQALAPSRRKV